MAEKRGETSLPHVGNDDIAFALFEDITDPSHQRRWKRFADNNQELAFEILRRAEDIPIHGDKLDMVKEAIDLTTFALSTIERALYRRVTTTSVDDADAVPPPSALPRDGR